MSAVLTAAQGAGLALRRLAKRFGAKTVLRDVDLDIGAGEFIVIVGRSGCGKTTLLRLIAGLDAPDEGELRIDDEAATDCVRVMFQEHRLLPWASLEANVRIGCGPARDSAEARAKARAALTQVGIGERAGDWPSVLSGGQKQRASLARALVSNPRVLALDEPLGALDALTRIEMQNLLEAVWLKERFTAILVTHDVAEAVRLGDRIVLLEGGEIAEIIPVDLPRPRRRGDPAFARIEDLLLSRLLGATAS